MECLGEGTPLGTDEQGCYAEVETTESVKYDSTLEEESKSVTLTELNQDRDSQRHQAVVKTPERDTETDLWDLLKEKAVDESQVDHREVIVTPTPIDWPCGGLLQTFYGTFSPPPNRGTALFCVWTLDPQDSRPLKLDLQQLVLGPGDRLTVFNREQAKGDVLKIVSFL